MRRLRQHQRLRWEPAWRSGAAMLDYVLVLGAVFALASLIVPASMRIARAAYDMLSVLISWPFL
jgi:hypothetical protein